MSDGVKAVLCQCGHSGVFAKDDEGHWSVTCCECKVSVKKAGSVIDARIAWNELQSVDDEPVTAFSILDKAQDHMKDRASTYDSEGERSISKTISAFKIITDDGLMNTDERGWLFMALLKMVRAQSGKLRMDSYEDGAAYFALAGESAAVERGGK